MKGKEQAMWKLWIIFALSAYMLVYFCSKVTKFANYDH